MGLKETLEEIDKMQSDEMLAEEVKKLWDEYHATGRTEEWNTGLIKAMENHLHRFESEHPEENNEQ